MPRSTSAASTITILRELFAKYGIPVQCVSGKGPQFRSEEFTRFLKMNGVKHVRVAPYHAASKGLAERMVQSFKKFIKVCKGSKLSTQQRIKNVLLKFGRQSILVLVELPLVCSWTTSFELGYPSFVRMWERISWIPRLSRRQHMMCTRGF